MLKQFYEQSGMRAFEFRQDSSFMFFHPVLSHKSRQLVVLFDEHHAAVFSVSNPTIPADVAGLTILRLRNDREGAPSVSGLTSQRYREDLQPPELGNRIERSEETGRNVRKLELSRARQVSREADAGLDVNHMEEGKHRRAAVLNFLFGSIESA